MSFVHIIGSTYLTYVAQVSSKEPFEYSMHMQAAAKIKNKIKCCASHTIHFIQVLLLYVLKGHYT